MIRLLKFIITGSWHEHEWETMKIGTFRYSGDFKSGECGVAYLRCKTCGNWKHKEFK